MPRLCGVLSSVQNISERFRGVQSSSEGHRWPRRAVQRSSEQFRTVQSGSEWFRYVNMEWCHRRGPPRATAPLLCADASIRGALRGSEKRATGAGLRDFFEQATATVATGDDTESPGPLAVAPLRKQQGRVVGYRNCGGLRGTTLVLEASFCDCGGLRGTTLVDSGPEDEVVTFWRAAVGSETPSSKNGAVLGSDLGSETTESQSR